MSLITTHPCMTTHKILWGECSGGAVCISVGCSSMGLHASCVDSVFSLPHPSFYSFLGKFYKGCPISPIKSEQQKLWFLDDKVHSVPSVQCLSYSKHWECFKHKTHYPHWTNWTILQSHDDKHMCPM
jgi:hypothetical protein